MAKSFRRFREDFDDMYEASEDDRVHKDMKLQSRRDQRRKKARDRFAALDERDDE